MAAWGSGGEAHRAGGGGCCHAPSKPTGFTPSLPFTLAVEGREIHSKGGVKNGGRGGRVVVGRDGQKGWEDAMREEG